MREIIYLAEYSLSIAYIASISTNTENKKFGSRHRSALGLSEKTSCIVVTLSEESGKIHIMRYGKYNLVSEKEFFNKMASI